MGLLFIGGSQRTGSTLLQKILCSGPDTNPMIGECTYLNALLKAYAIGKQNFEHQTQDYFASRQDFRQKNRQILLTLFAEWQQHHAAQHLVLKHPQMSSQIPNLFELVPEAKFIIILRDLRDIAASMVEVGKRMENKGGKHAFNSDNLATLARKIQMVYQPILKYGEQNIAFRQACRFISYEALVQSPETQIQAICTFAGMEQHEFKPGQTYASRSQSVSDAETQKQLSVWGTDLSKQPVSTSSIGRYRKVFNPEEIDILEQVGKNYLTRFNYL